MTVYVSKPNFILRDELNKLSWTKQLKNHTKLVVSDSDSFAFSYTNSPWNYGTVGKGVALDLGIVGTITSISSIVGRGTELGRNYYYNGTSDIKKSDGAASKYVQVAGTHTWHSAPPAGNAGSVPAFTPTMTLDVNGNLGIGTIGPGARTEIYVNRTSSTNAVALLLNDNVTGSQTNGVYKSIRSLSNSGSSVSEIRFLETDGTNNNTAIVFATSATAGALTERVRVTNMGYLKASNSGSYLNSTGSYHETVSNVSNDRCLAVVNTNASLAATVAGIQVTYTASSPNNTTNNFIYGEDSTAQRFGLRSNGGLANYSGNDVNLSDRREKTNFAPAKSYLDTICAIPVQTFEYIDQSEDDPGLTLGVVAQDVQQVAPELVMESNWGTTEDPKMRLSVYQTDLQYALMKCIQELKAQNDELKARVAALETKD